MYVYVYTYAMPWPHFVSAIAYANCFNILFSITLHFNLAIVYSKSVIVFEYTYVHIIQKLTPVHQRLEILTYACVCMCMMHNIRT